MKNNNDILEFYRQTSCYTDLGPYKEFAKNLPNDVAKLCVLQRKQTIHSFMFKDKNLLKQTDSVWGDMTQIPITRLHYEEHIFPTAQSILGELLRRNPEYSIKRQAKDKLNIVCRGQSILLASVLKAKSVPARARSGFVEYIHNDGVYYDHWVTEYFDEVANRWKMVDADMYCAPFVTGFNLDDIPSNRFLSGAEAWLGLRQKTLKDKEVLFSSTPPVLGLKSAMWALFYDFHALMNDEVIIGLVPQYTKDKNYDLSERELFELDNLAKLLLNPSDNFRKIRDVWQSNLKFRIMVMR